MAPTFQLRKVSIEEHESDAFVIHYISRRLSYILTNVIPNLGEKQINKHMESKSEMQLLVIDIEVLPIVCIVVINV